MNSALLVHDPSAVGTSVPTNVTDTTAIAVRGLSKTFTLYTQGGARLHVLESVDLDVSAGECIALSGPSGAGKSTLLRCLAANYQPTAGQVWIRHAGAFTDIVTAEPSAIIDMRRHTVGWVSQFLRVIPRVPAIDIVDRTIRVGHIVVSRSVFGHREGDSDRAAVFVVHPAQKASESLRLHLPSHCGERQVA